MLIVTNDLDKARTATGALAAYEEIIGAFEMRPAKEDAEDEAPFTDPATRLSLRKAAK